MEHSDFEYNHAKCELDAWLPRAKLELDVQYNTTMQEVDTHYNATKHELDVHYNIARKEVDTCYNATKHKLEDSYNISRHELDDLYDESKYELVVSYLNANRDNNYIEEKNFKLSLENAWLPSFVDDYINYHRTRFDLKIITSDGQVTLAHKLMVPCNSDAAYFMMERNDKIYIMEDFVNKEALLLLLELLYLDECFAGPRMEKYGSKVMVASSLFVVTSKDLIAAAMKDSITLQNCHEVWKAINICTTKYNDTFYNHDGRGLRKKCKDFLQRSAETSSE